MTLRIKYELLMLWCGFWLRFWGLWQFLGIAEDLDNRFFGWIVSQCGFGYVGTFEMYKDLVEGE